jgi:hypothetical protein
MKPTLASLTLATLSTLVSPAHAGPFSYECEIKSVQQLSDEGFLVEGLPIYKVGDSFHIERATGVVLGGGIGNSSYPVRQVLDPGSAESGYKLLTLSNTVPGTDGSRNAIYIEVKEWAEAFIKPFVVFTGTHVIAGACR